MNIVKAIIHAVSTLWVLLAARFVRLFWQGD